jgi:hypothetical protein
VPASSRFLVLVSDGREEADSGASATNHELPTAVLAAVRVELENRGFRIGPAAPELFLNIVRLNVERRTDSNSAHASFEMQVRLERRDGKVIYTHDADGVYDESKVKDFSEKTAEHVADLAAQDCVQRLFADPQFTAALSVAHDSD